MPGKFFGKRIVPASALSAEPRSTPAGRDRNHETRKLPEAIWDGPNGETLRQLGFLPDDPANLIVTPQRARAMEDEATARMNALVAKVNAHIPGVSVLPWAMIPWAVWQGLNAEFLIKTDFLPSSPWNNMLLAADAQSSAFLGLPQHPRAARSSLDKDLTRLVDELRIESRDEVTRNVKTISDGFVPALNRYEQIKQAQFKKLFALARYVTADTFGEAVCARHDELFGIGLAKVTS